MGESFFLVLLHLRDLVLGNCSWQLWLMSLQGLDSQRWADSCRVELGKDLTLKQAKRDWIRTARHVTPAFIVDRCSNLSECLQRVLMCHRFKPDLPNDLRLSCGAQAEAAASCKISFPRRPKRCWAPTVPSAC